MVRLYRSHLGNSSKTIKLEGKRMETLWKITMKNVFSRLRLILKHKKYHSGKKRETGKLFRKSTLFIHLSWMDSQNLDLEAKTTSIMQWPQY